MYKNLTAEDIFKNITIILLVVFGKMGKKIIGIERPSLYIKNYKNGEVLIKVVDEAETEYLIPLGNFLKWLKGKVLRPMPVMRILQYIGNDVSYEFHPIGLRPIHRQVSLSDFLMMIIGKQVMVLPNDVEELVAMYRLH